MDEEAARQAALGLGWSKQQAVFLGDRIRNALVPLKARGTDDATCMRSIDKILQVVQAIEDSVAETCRDVE